MAGFSEHLFWSNDKSGLGRILIVENSQLYISLIESTIKEVFSGSIDIASSLEDVKRLTKQHGSDYFLVFSNLNLPGTTFGEAVSYVRSLDIPAVVFTSSVDREIAVKMKSLGVVDYVLKENVANLSLMRRLVRRLNNNRRMKAMVVDDSRMIRLQVKLLLERYLFTVIEAKDGQEALEVVEKNSEIKLIVTDNEMPRMNGFELVKRLRRFKTPKDLAIFGMSATEDASLAADFIRFGADDFASKPINEEVFATRISMCMDKLDMLNELSYRATTDFLTGLSNRMFFMSTAQKLYANASRGNLQLCAAMLDIDFFKKVNDTYGHDAGDKVLKGVAQALKKRVREADILARMGGEEFCLITANMEKKHQHRFFEELLETVSSLTFKVGKEDIAVTVSIGVSTNLGTSLEDMLSKADEALYQAKENGRNQVVFAAV